MYISTSKPLNPISIASSLKHELSDDEDFGNIPGIKNCQQLNCSMKKKGIYRRKSSMISSSESRRWFLYGMAL